MILQILAAVNFLLGVYDSYLTAHRMRVFGKNFELNRLIKSLSTPLGPDLASVIGVLGPCVGWTYIFCYFNLPWALALTVGFNLKRFEQQLTSVAFEREARKIQRMINEFGSTNTATLPVGELTPPVDPPNSNEHTE